MFANACSFTPAGPTVFNVRAFAWTSTSARHTREHASYPRRALLPAAGRNPRAAAPRGARRAAP
ncbi:hypothetical protein C6T59_20285 [Burkholderia multivorans]|nr:hypothetical protein C6Q01_18535 [Burkholderia multivorans]PRF85779.1 hypothetical protein C6Q23_25805 [Burkholderia multivorans]PRG63490.1 hypothetical protein C6T59_20285 [Burkholderia multivorans]